MSVLVRRGTPEAQLRRWKRDGLCAREVRVPFFFKMLTLGITFLDLYMFRLLFLIAAPRSSFHNDELAYQLSSMCLCSRDQTADVYGCLSTIGSD